MLKQGFSRIILASLLLILVVGCGSDGAEPPETSVSGSGSADTETPLEATDTPLPTSMPSPTDSPAPTATATPEPVNIEEPFWEDFAGSLANVGWEWFNEDPDRWSISEEGWLVLEAADPPFGENMVNLLHRPLPAEVDVIVTTVVRADPAENFKQAALYFFNDEWSYVSILIGFCRPCLPESEGHGLFVEAFANGETMLPEPVFIPREASDTEVYLRLEYSPEAGAVAGSYAFEIGSWEPAFLLRDVPQFTMTGIGAANLPGPEGSSADLVAEFDFFELQIP